ncbi:MAG TPA: GNAT family N-acetyltransferase [Caulobacteraceae bacterium]|jgi:predicted GNAT family acetyltransferase|nr:GNAT family N-acetyltransferase [Caulobacteraceae bacterium]
MTDVHDIPARHRFEMLEQGQTVFADYRRDGRRLIIDHVEAPESLRGTGAAGRFMEGLVAAARAEGSTIVPICSYAAAWLRRHRELAADVVE